MCANGKFYEIYKVFRFFEGWFWQTAFESRNEDFFRLARKPNEAYFL